MSASRAAWGRRGEELAAGFLQRRGYEILCRNVHCRYGEIDLVCRDGATLAFCEVKLRRSDRFGLPEEGVTPRKLQRLILSAQTYLVGQGLEDADWRIDVVAIDLDRSGALVRATLHQGVSL